MLVPKTWSRVISNSKTTLCSRPVLSPTTGVGSGLFPSPPLSQRLAPMLAWGGGTHVAFCRVLSADVTCPWVDGHPQGSPWGGRGPSCPAPQALLVPFPHTLRFSHILRPAPSCGLLLCGSLQLVALKLVFPGDIQLWGCGHLLQPGMEPGGLGTQKVVLVTPASWPVSRLPGLHGHRDRPVQWPSAGLEKPVSTPFRYLGWKKDSLGLWEEKAKLPTSTWRRAEGMGAPLSHLLLSTSGGGAGGQAEMGSTSGVITQHVSGGPPLSPGPSLGPWGEPLAVNVHPMSPFPLQADCVSDGLLDSRDRDGFSVPSSPDRFMVSRPAWELWVFRGGSQICISTLQL